METILVKNKRKITVIGIILVFFVIMLIWMATLLLENQEIYNNIYIESVDVGQLTKEEALERIEEIFQEQLENYKILLEFNEKQWEFHYSLLGYHYEYEEAVEKAYNVGRSGSTWERLTKIYSLRSNQEFIQLEASYNQEAFDKIVLEVKDEVNIKPINAVVKRRNGKFIIEDDVVGYEIDEFLLKEEIRISIEAFSTEYIEIPTNVIKAQVTTADLNNIQNVLGEFKTSFSANDKGRNTNIALAASQINGVLLMPNDVFSFNNQTGERGEDKGYQKAPVIVNGQLVQGLGGGICQVSTTLYNAVVRSNLEIIQRQNHSLPVAYVPLGHDATVAFGHIDFQFMNNTEYPVYLESYVEGNQIHIGLYGKKVEDITVQLHSEVIETIQPRITTKEDPSLYIGEKRIEKEAKQGYRVNTYKIYLKDGKELNRELISNDYYTPVHGIVIEGRKPKATAESEEKQELEELIEEAIEETSHDD
ncbi:VanW family protein [Alkaliphilus peptidifermentans]|uniref:Vancomycin resistance protein YoaR, contains peptidoglycan-binding and VanW domains n=1 Tax=Alkaliphilus peptidifermentans DSM 18978 TaxID=1120976 RepID=A0A1G5K293_9FIRM|nr:VanW family protein [Alkaliphilus peptidifermentans]SCY94792.1 Vancomycin resistance protein YoaR, contains peptidoglycan-binding and VanW domains [Alkaliphilus peptidifermentans DSM 18978]